MTTDWNDTEALDRLDAEDAARHIRLARPEALAEAAAWYASAEIACFPLMPRDKQPLTPNGFLDASTDPGQIQAWWARWPLANVGAPTGITFDVVDVDGPRGVLSIAGNADRPDLVTALRTQSIGIVSTPRSGGLHYYIPPTGRKTTGGKRQLVPGVDTRGAGGYVVLPPSVTDEHGPDRRYVWLKPLVLP